jgi:hypothetical protein
MVDEADEIERREKADRYLEMIEEQVDYRYESRIDDQLNEINEGGYEEENANGDVNISNYGLSYDY